MRSKVSSSRKPALAESFRQVSGDGAHLKLAGEARQHGPQVQIRAGSVEALQAFDEHGRHNQHGVAEPVRVANEQPGLIGRGGRQEVQIQAQAGEGLRHDLS